MSKITMLLSSLSIAMASSAFADVCPDASSTTITQKADGTFTVNPPADYIYTGYSYPISQTGPISFATTEINGSNNSFLKSMQGPYSNVKVAKNVSCWYGVRADSSSKKLNITRT